MLGGSIAAPAVVGILNGCQPTGLPDWTPKLLSKEQAALVGEIANLILPTTDSPGAKDLAVDEFIDLMLHDSFAEEDQQRLMAGLDKLNADCEGQFGKPFVKLSAAQKSTILGLMDQNEMQQQTEPKHFYRILKELTLLGYFTSETIMSEYLKHRPVPGIWEGCVDVGQEEPLHVDNNV